MNRFIYVFKVSLVFYFFVVVAGCNSMRVIENKHDYYLLEDIERFEYKYSLYEGIKYRLLGDYSRSVYFFKRCLKIFPYSDVAFYELSKIYFYSDEISESVAHAKSALDIDPDNIWYYYNLGLIHYESGQYDDAISVYQRALDIFPGETEIYFTLANIYTDSKEFDQALEIFDRLEAKIGVDPKFSVPKQHIYIEKAEYELAYEEINKLIAKYPEDPRYIGMLAELYQLLNMYEEAIDSYERLFMIDPDNGFAQLSISEFLLENKEFERAFFYIESALKNDRLDYKSKLTFISAVSRDAYIVNNYSDIIESFFILLKDTSTEKDIIFSLMSEFYLNIQEYTKAEEILDSLYFDYPDNEVVAEQFIGTLSYNGKYNEVIDVGMDMIKKFPENFVIHYTVGIIQHAQGNLETAIKILKRSLDFDISDYKVRSNIYSSLGDIYYSLGEYPKSDQYFEIAISLDSLNLVALNNYSYYLARREVNLDVAKQYSLRAIENDPDNASFLDTHAWVLYKLEEYSDAVKFIELAYMKGGNYRYEIVQHYGEILIKLERFQEAETFFNKALELKID